MEVSNAFEDIWRLKNCIPTSCLLTRRYSANFKPGCSQGMYNRNVVLCIKANSAGIRSTPQTYLRSPASLPLNAPTTEKKQPNRKNKICKM
jgi:hypothetical protein